MKYKVGDKIIFNQDCRLAFSCIPKGKTGEITDIVDTGLTIAYRIKMKDYPNATVPTDKADDCCERVNTAPSVTKRITNKHHILNGLLNSDGSVDGEKLMEKLSNQSNDMAKGSHYEKAAMQPLEVMQRIMTIEQFKGFLLGNYIKYRLRSEFKGQHDSDEYKARQYAYWLEMVKEGRIINPSKDKVPFDYKFSII
jgi:hypothetical protein